MGKMKPKLIRLDRESVIPTLKPKLIETLVKLIESDSDKKEFLTFCKRVEYTVRAWYTVKSEDMMMMEKSNFKVVSNQEVAVALAGKYRLNLPIKVDEAKIDRTLLSKYFAENPHENLPEFSDQFDKSPNIHKYVIFRRGIGMDQMTAYFIDAKVDTMLSRLYHGLLKVKMCLKNKKQSQDPKKEDEENPNDSDQDDLVVERILIENMNLSPVSLFQKTTIQEPTFERIIIVYRLVEKPEDKDRGIFVKHFKNIPMADMEIVFVTVITQVLKSNTNIKVIAAVGCAVIGYIAKTYFTFQSNFTAYQNLITRSMYDKQLDSGRGTLLHLCDNVKEIIVAFFIGCEEMMEKEFEERLNFDVHDALQKLEKLGIVSQDSEGRYSGVGIERANQIIGTTTEELVIQAEDKSPPP
ncbi:hypothetical protein V2J09_001674 [Rumex salicifolius]